MLTSWFEICYIQCSKCVVHKLTIHIVTSLYGIIYSVLKHMYSMHSTYELLKKEFVV